MALNTFTQAEKFLGMSEAVWQGISAFISTILVAVTLGYITTHLLARQEAMNNEEGKLLKARTDAYLEILDSMARMEERKVIMDPDFEIRNNIQKNCILMLRDRPAVEYPPYMESYDKFFDVFRKMVYFYEEKLYLASPKTYKEFLYVYCYFTRIHTYYFYLQTLTLPNGEVIDEEKAKEIIADFYPKLGMIIDFDLVVMQAKFEKALVCELYRPKFCKKPPFKSDAKITEFFLLRLTSTCLGINEYGILNLLKEITAKKMGFEAGDLDSAFVPSDLVVQLPHDFEV